MPNIPHLVLQLEPPIPGGVDSGVWLALVGHLPRLVDGYLRPFTPVDSSDGAIYTQQLARFHEARTIRWLGKVVDFTANVHDTSVELPGLLVAIRLMERHLGINPTREIPHLKPVSRTCAEGRAGCERIMAMGK